MRSSPKHWNPAPNWRCRWLDR